ncbi:MAG: T9SS type A sorting domain-containing protein [Bacteroidia bacterium]
MKKIILFFVSVFFVNCLFAQTLSLPPRSATALTGSQFETTISSPGLSLTARENLIYTEISNGNVPDFYRNLVPVTSYAIIGGVNDSVTYYAIPDYLAIGCDTNYFLCPMSPMLATSIADLTGCTLPTRKMVNDIWAAATVKLDPSPIAPGPGMTTVPVFNDHNTTVKGQRDAVIGTFPLGNLVSGDKKDVVISNLIYSIANRVVIYGWHYTSGTPIQPLSNVHADTYMDYSHGIRLVQNAVIYHGASSTTVKNILQSSTLNPLLSDEGSMASPEYPYGSVVSSLNKPVSFAVTRLNSTSIKLIVENDVDVTHYKVYTSTDGITYGPPVTLVKTGLLLTGLTSNQIYFVKIEAYNSTYGVTSPTSEVLAATTSVNTDSVLVVNGFDRAIAGNTYNFIIQHGKAIWNKQKGFSSATNEALTSGLINIQDYYAADYILGEESTADETFSNSEQTIIKQYLQNGGDLFVSGSEIGWDLDHLGSTSDKNFYNNYLMASYLLDAPGGIANSCYTGKPSGTFYSIDSTQFDNGTHGTYNVSYPDVITAINGSVPDLTYCSGTEVSALHFGGLFPGGTFPGKLVHWAFPFEAVYNISDRNNLMSTIIDYFFTNGITTGISEKEKTNYKVYPNPSSGIFNIEISSEEVNKTVYITDLTGRVVFTDIVENNFKTIDLSDLSSGIYILMINNHSQKLIIDRK